MSLGRKGSQGKKGEPERGKKSTGPATKQISKKNIVSGRGENGKEGKEMGGKSGRNNKTIVCI